ncbi:GNAT family N-acetyltransferase [Chitinimonas arctica]|uniref:GNAT family N-acetyltransferase n=1 Tax=Chitinimonas arctica TaxID=2594795 RepID=A0A516SLD8_9NEIS|nr:GNAT family N-acetyltransferase [Chitinimonas arctica]QDQ28979.1 GNAT family N-acetyltransferase [Chitinimonas arctica]
MLIRLASGDDAALWQAIRLEALQNHPEAFGSSYQEERDMPLATVAAKLIDPLNRVWVAEEGGQLLGTATARRESAAKARHRTSLFAMYVVPSARQRGIGRQLVEAVIRSARDELEADWLQLGVERNNQAAFTLYQRLGFVSWGCEPDSLRVNGQSYDEYHMALDLRATRTHAGGA